MGVNVRVAVARKMLARGDDAGIVQTSQVCHSHLRHEVRLLAEGAHPDHGIGRVIVDVENGSQVHVPPDRLDLGPDHAAGQICHIGRPRRSEGHIAGKISAAGNPRNPAAFLVH